MAVQNHRSNDASQRVIFSAPELLAVRQALQENLQNYKSEGEEVWFDGGLVEDRVLVELRLSNVDRTRLLVMEAATKVDVNNAKDLLEARAGIVEFIGAMFEEWLEEEGLRSPNLDWKEFDYAGRDYVFRGALSNDKLQSAADDFLRAHGLDPDSLEGDGDPEDPS